MSDTNAKGIYNDAIGLIFNVSAAIDIALRRSASSVMTAPVARSIDGLSVCDFDDVISAPTRSCEIMPENVPRGRQSRPRRLHSVGIGRSQQTDIEPHQRSVGVTGSTTGSSSGSGSISNALDYLHNVYCTRDKPCDDCKFVKEQCNNIVNAPAVIEPTNINAPADELNMSGLGIQRSQGSIESSLSADDNVDSIIENEMDAFGGMIASARGIQSDHELMKHIIEFYTVRIARLITAKNE